MIPPKQVQEILDLTRIEEVIEDFVTLRKRGVNLIGLCPFHNEKSPSFNVNPTRNIFKCFGCGKGGDAVTFLMEHEHFSYPDALRWLARKYNVEIQEIVQNLWAVDCLRWRFLSVWSCRVSTLRKREAFQ
jgi:DNA primase